MRIIVGISGASGVIMGYHLLLALRRIEDMEIHLVVTQNARKNWGLESKLSFSKLEELAHVIHSDNNMAASISSGSFITDGMIVLPCSMKTLSAISNGYAANLLVRAADVCLKENRKVVLVPREMPLSKLHIRNLQKVSDMGCIIIPPMLTFYNQPECLADQINHVIGKILMQFGLSHRSFIAWEGAEV